MKVKIYIFRKNSPWGIIKNPVKGNEYKHVINFVNDTEFEPNTNLGSKKLEFINTFLMANGKDLITEINGFKTYKILSPKCFINERVFRYKVDIKEFGDAGFDRLLNADYACVLKEVIGKTYYDFYSLKVLGCEGNYINFEFELDVPFTFQPFKFKRNTSNFMLRGHIDRFNIVNNKININENVLNIKEDLDLIPSNFNNFTIEQRYTGPPGPPGLKNIIKNLRCAVLYVLTNTETGEQYYNNAPVFGPDGETYRQFHLRDVEICKTGFGLNKKWVSLPYKIFLVPFLDGDFGVENIYVGEKTFSRLDDIIFQLMVKKIPGINLLKVHILNYFPLEHFNIEWVDNKINIFPKSTLIRHYIPTCVIKINDRLWNSACGAINISSIGKVKNGEHSELFSYESENILSKIPLPDFNSLLLPKKQWYKRDKNINLECKMYGPQYYKLSIQKLNSVLKCDFSLRNILGFENLNISGIFSFIPDKYSMLYFFKKKYYKDDNVENNLAVISNKNGLLVENETYIPLKTEKYGDYIQSNKTALTASRQADKMDLEMTTLAGTMSGLVAGTKLGGPIGAMIGATLGAGISYFKANYDVEKREMMRLATLQDLKNSPSSVILNNNNSIGLTSQLPVEIDKLKLNIIELNNEDKIILFDYLYRYGYKVNKLVDLNNIIGSRYYFNYVECIDVFNTIDTSQRNMSTTIKQNIDELFSNGVFIWNYRNKETWNGIMTFKKENIEMSLTRK